MIEFLILGSWRGECCLRPPQFNTATYNARDIHLTRSFIRAWYAYNYIKSDSSFSWSPIGYLNSATDFCAQHQVPFRFLNPLIVGSTCIRLRLNHAPVFDFTSKISLLPSDKTGASLLDPNLQKSQSQIAIYALSHWEYDFTISRGCVHTKPKVVRNTNCLQRLALYLTQWLNNSSLSRRMSLLLLPFESITFCLLNSNIL